MKKRNLLLNKHFFRKIVVAYLGIVVLFAVFNWQVFICNSTAYLISDQLNKHIVVQVFPFDEFDLANYHSDAKDNMPITVSGFSDMMKFELGQLDSINRTLENRKREEMLFSRVIDSLGEIVTREKETNIESFKEQKLLGLQQQIERKKEFLESQDSTEMILLGQYVELSRLEYEYAKKNAEVMDYVLSNVILFIPDTLYAQYIEYREEEIMLFSEVWGLERLRMEVIERINGKISSFHQNRHDSVGFWDFMYYSICVSTTVSFGDIAPNNGFARGLAVLEILMCLVLLGLVVGALLERLKSSENGTTDSVNHQNEG